MSNGNIYFLLTEGLNFITAELAKEGIRPTGEALNGFDWVWLGDGTLVFANQATLGGEVTWEKYLPTGFDANSNPQFSQRQILAQRKNIASDEPLYRVGAWLSVVFLEKNQLVTFDARPKENGMGGGFHLQVAKANRGEAYNL